MGINPDSKVDRLLLCSCTGSMSIDASSAQKAAGAQAVSTCEFLCKNDLGMAADALSQEGTTLIACSQQADQFDQLAEEVNAPGRLLTADIRDRAGWTDDADAFAKQSALLAEAVLERPVTPTKDVTSEGVCLVLGTGETALDAAEMLGDRLAVTCLLEAEPDSASPSGKFDLAVGKLRQAKGSLGGFEIIVDGFAEAHLAGRGSLVFGDRTDGAKSTCDIIVDLRGEGSLFAAGEKRDGYLRADPKDPASVARLLFQAADLQGEFEKPLYIRFDGQICAHTRAGQSGCDRCLSVCPTGAISPAGDTVAIDADICAGCGSCAAVCPSGAVSYDDPPVSFLFTRLRVLASTYKSISGDAPRALFHEPGFGAEMIRLSARFGRGLPADVIPVETSHIEGLGHAEIMAALGVGFAQVFVLAGPKTDRSALERELDLSRAIIGGTGFDSDRVIELSPMDPEVLEEALYAPSPGAIERDPILPVGGRREVTRLAATALAESQESAPCFDLPNGAPYGAIEIDKEACTLCLACVSLCPVGALGDTPDQPQVRFQETACLQCGICASTCPEDAITLAPRLNLDPVALSHEVLHEEEPFCCIECGKPFGVKSTIDRIVSKLEGKHWMFQNSDNSKLIQMCDDCRVNAQYHQENSPFQGGDRPRVRTTQDYIDDRKKH